MPQTDRPSPARVTAFSVLMRVEREGAYSNIALRAALRRASLSGQDGAFCAALVYGTLERAVTLDAVIGRFLRAPVKDREVTVILRMGAYQILYGQVPARAAVDESVRLCRYAHKASACGLCNAVLRRVAENGCGNLPVWLRLGVEKALYDRLVRDCGEESAARFLTDALRPAPLFVRVRTGRISEDALIRRLEAEGTQAEKTSLPGALMLKGTGDPSALPAFRDGLFHVQDLSSQLCALSLDARPGMRVLDACAAPGGKTFTLAGEMDGRGEIVACDVHPHRVELIREGAQRLGFENIIPTVQDSTAYNKKFTNFDRVLCDVPCSGLGGLRRRPELRRQNPARRREEARLGVIPRLGDSQYKILETAAHYVREGGLLVYSTCTLLCEENEDVAERFLAEHPAFEAAPLEQIGSWRRTLIPSDDWRGDGFFLARFRRKGAAE